MNSSISDQAISIGVIADTSLQQHLIGTLLADQGMQVSVNTSPWKFTGSDLQVPVDLWYVDLTLDEGFDDFLDLILGTIDAPVLIGDGQAPVQNSDEYPQWKRRFLSKLSEQLKRVQVPDVVDYSRLPAGRPKQPPLALPDSLRNLELANSIPTRVWLLGASLGGPSAVKEFLDALPAGLPVAFVYAQHIDGGFQQVLADTIGRHSVFDVVIGGDGTKLEYGKVVLATVEQEILFNQQACLEGTGREWAGPYQPNIGQVMMNILRRFGSGSGAIIFSGMGEDGVDASLTYNKIGAPVWAQAADSSESSTMPDAICKDGYCSFRGSPRELAERLIRQVAGEVQQNKARSQV